MPDWLTAAQIGELVVVGAAAGLLGGLLGIGGGLVMIPALLLILGDRFGPESIHVYTLASISTSLILAVPASVRHARARAIVYPLVRSIVPGAILGVVLGVLGAGLFTERGAASLKRIFGGFIVAVAAFNTIQARRSRRDDAWRATRCPTPRRWFLIGGAVGLPSGIIAGMLGVAGGIWSVPMQHLAFGVGLRAAIGNSTGMIVFVSLATAIVKGVWVASRPELHVAHAWTLTACLAPGAIVGGWLGAGLTHRFPIRALRIAVDVLLAIAGARLIMGA